MFRHSVFIHRNRRNPQASRSCLAGDAGPKFCKISGSLFVMNNRLGGFRALRSCVVQSEEEQDPVWTACEHFTDPDQPMGSRIAADGACHD